MKHIIFFISLCIQTTMLTAQQGLKGNAASISITPPLEWQYTLGGYGARMSKPAEGIHDDIRAKALVLKDGDKKFVMITADILGFPPNVRPMLAKKLASQGWSEDHILLLPSHSHSSLEMFALNNKNVFNMPAIGIFQPQLLEFVLERLSTLIQQTESELADIKVGTAQMMLEGMNRNRRGAASVDKELTVTRIDYLIGGPMAILVNWTAHPTIMDDKDMWVSGGWPGYLQRELEDWIGDEVVAMYYNGAVGDQSVIAREGVSHYEKAEYYGRRIARQAKAVYDQIELKNNASLKYAQFSVALPAHKAHPDFMKTGGKEYQLDENKIQMLLEQVFPETTQIPFLKIDDLLIIGVPGEMIAELGLELKNAMRKSGVAFPVIGGIANEWISYILTEEEYHRGGYETSTSFYGPTLGSIIYEAIIEASEVFLK
ncbi:MAG: neutral/alkaline non-lysosomal ceramidase N-terminal domain-containing protein [Cyclobacteriaceae bacterium]|nr:neutral/alkaline non-lysosomal ceramidase N-terminal domain-containing protein [Cyclobacteriaceae bacterium]